MSENNRQHILAQMCFVILWSSGFIGAKFGLEYVGVFTFLFLRYALLAFILLSIALSWYGTQTISWRYIRQTALIGFLAHALYLSTMSMAFALGATAGTAALIGGLQPVITGLVANRAIGERTASRQWLGLVVGFTAIALIVLNGMAVGGSVTVYALLFTSVGCITMASLHQRWLETQSCSERVPLTVNLAIQCSVSAVALSLPAWMLEGRAVVWNIEFVAVLLWLSIVVSLLGFGALWFLVQRRPATEVASLVYFTVPVTMVLGYFAFSDTLTQMDVLGLILAAVGVKLVHSGELNWTAREQAKA